MRRNPERVAWVVLSLSFLILCLIVVGVPLGIRHYIQVAEKPQEASVQSLVGTVVVDVPVGSGPTPLGKDQSLAIPEGTVIRVDETSEAVVTFFDHSFMRMFSGTTVQLDRSRAPRYASSALPNTVYLNLMGGRVRIGTALSVDSPLDFRVQTLHATSTLATDGSYAIEVSNDRSDIATYRGDTRVSAAGRTVNLGPRQRTEVVFGEAPQPAVGIARNLIVNSDFRDGLNKGWRAYNDQGTDGGDIDGVVELVVDAGVRSAHFVRQGGQGNHCETILEQVIDAQMPDAPTSLVVRATVQVRYQSLSGGGYLSSEYPLMIRLTYRDVYDSEAEWVQGFYYQNIADTPTTYGLQVPHDRWYLFESDNLLEQLPIRPYKIIRIRVYAAGWEYESLISDIYLIVE